MKITHFNFDMSIINFKLRLDISCPVSYLPTRLQEQREVRKAQCV